MLHDAIFLLMHLRCKIGEHETLVHSTGRVKRLIVKRLVLAHHGILFFQSVLRKVEPEDALKISDAVMSALLQLLITQSGQGGGAKEDALLAVATLVEGIVPPAYSFATISSYKKRIQRKIMLYFSDWNEFYEIYGSIQADVNPCSEEH